MKIRFILNPRSGHLRRTPGTVQLVRDFVARRPHEAALAATERPGHATELAAAAASAGAGLVVAVGGDGTMNEVARALVGRDTALGLLPCGSGNGLARHLGIPLRPAGALAVIEHGKIRAIDCGRINGHPFFCAAGTGFEAHIVEIFNRTTHRGFLRYLITSAREFWRYRPLAYTVTDGVGAPRRLSAFTLAVANAGQYGNDAFIAPTAAIDDGLLHLVAVPPVTFASGLPLLYRLFRGRLHRDPRVTTLAAARLLITGESPMPFHTDGESQPAAARLEIAVEPRRLRVLVPAD